MRTNNARARKQKARNFGGEAVLVRAMDCIVHTAAVATGSTDAFLRQRGWTACGGAACAHHVHPRQRGGVGEGRLGLFPGCARHGDEAGEASPTKGPSSKRRAFENLYSLDVVNIADAIALAHEPPLGIRGLAARWAWWWERARAGNDDEAIVHTVAPSRLVGYDLAALMAWTRRRMEREVNARRDLRMGTPSRPDYRPGDDWDGLDDDDHTALSFAVGRDLGGVFEGPGSSDIDGGQALTEGLCEQAGWPS